jgi:hypothetical protein
LQTKRKQRLKIEPNLPDIPLRSGSQRRRFTKSSLKLSTNAGHTWLLPALSGTLVLFLVYIGFIFWWQDLQYSLPTPKPLDLKQPPLGTKLARPTEIAAVWARHPGTFLFLHFYNPHCPCSRFNLDHVRSLFERYHGAVTFVAVVQGPPSASVLEKLARSLPGMEIVVDKDRQMAESFGVYATPQAVILNANAVLRYRGNYNSSRYCNDERTEYARLAMEALLAGRTPQPSDAVEISYGCPLRKKAARALPEAIEF